MFAQFVLVLLIFITLFSSINAYAVDALTKLHIESAFAACERALQMPTAESRGSLRVLRSLSKRYQRYRDKALSKDPELKNSQEQYNGELFVNNTYAEVYKTCESDLITKVVDTEAAIDNKVAQREERRASRQEEIKAIQKKTEAALVHVKQAVNVYCLQYLLHPELKDNLESKYDKEKQLALSTYPGIVKHFYDAVELEPITLEQKQVNKTISAWFEYCDMGFAGELEVLQEEGGAIEDMPLGDSGALEGPPLPPSLRTSRENDAMPLVEEDEAIIADEEGDQEYDMALGQAKGDRLQILEDEGRVPEYVSNENGDIQQSDRWQYEGDEHCIIYYFNANKIAERKEVQGECPPFE